MSSDRLSVVLIIAGLCTLLAGFVAGLAAFSTMWTLFGFGVALTIIATSFIISVLNQRPWPARGRDQLRQLNTIGTALLLAALTCAAVVGIAISGFIALVDGTTLQISPAQDALVGVGVIATVLGVVGFVGAAVVKFGIRLTRTPNGRSPDLHSWGRVSGFDWRLCW
ncbi:MULTISPECIES: hypothetical protein [Brevibacterium]|uniref:Uncharacterized protein n=4 Tax=Brevibacterium TaxID=1696 RepID=A0A2H1KDC7_BREAU|nr:MULTISPECIES: hypothetical protein [Brevibacterium]AZL11544.1 hypothetical protein CXR25_01005 [Brevibacterium aurantiacum]AZT98244.1 hypothetical protein CXR27_15495 [Brevibacterium aurantiacum]KAB1942487.1 hypothetical protein F8227_16975 [Brevibacterium linens ATCC 9172]RCS94274.1 hypothetical protein CIK60_18420 [Brevibacterium aurantiacum]SMX97817.1 hypothetical protein BAUR9175_03389 [Brevibacterium aurantiacum]